MDKETLEKWRQLAMRLVEVERRIKELFPLAQPPETENWEKANFKILTEDQGEELVKLAQEARKLRAEMARLSLASGETLGFVFHSFCGCYYPQELKLARMITSSLSSNCRGRIHPTRKTAGLNVGVAFMRSETGSERGTTTCGTITLTHMMNGITPSKVLSRIM